MYISDMQMVLVTTVRVVPHTPPPQTKAGGMGQLKKQDDFVVWMSLRSKVKGPAYAVRWRRLPSLMASQHLNHLSEPQCCQAWWCWAVVGL